MKMTISEVVDEIILEKIKDSLVLKYDIDVFVQEFAKPEDEIPAETTAEVPAETAAEVPAETAAAESFDDEGNLINEEIYKQTTNGEITLTKQETQKVQTIADLLDFLTDTNVKKTRKKSSIQEALKNILFEEKTTGKIITPFIQEVIYAAVSGELETVISKGDKLNITITYGNGDTDNIGFNINKNAGSSTLSTTMMKDGKVLATPFNMVLVNKQILYYRNSLV